MSLPALTAITHRWEGVLAGHLGRSEQVHVARRCADLGELLGCASAGIGRVAAVSVDLRGVDRSAIATLAEHGVAVLGVHPPGDEAGRRTLMRWGIAAVLPADATPEQVHAALETVVGENASLGPASGADTLLNRDAAASADDTDGQWATYLSHAAGGSEGPPEPGAAGADNPVMQTHGEMVAIWGPTGAPGRSTVAVHLAAELAETDSTIVVDADTYGASIAQMLAILDEAPGIAAAARAADQGTLDVAALARMAPTVQAGLRVLTGLPRADRWPELREHAVADVLDVCSELARWTVVDVGFCLEQDEEISFDTAAPRRNGVAIRVLEAADQIVVVGTADPVGLQRLLRAVAEIRESYDTPLRIVVTRVRATAVGCDPSKRVIEILRRFGGIEGVHLVLEDQEALDAALLEGLTLAQVRPASPARRGFSELAGAVSGRPEAPAQGRVLIRRRKT